MSATAARVALVLALGLGLCVACGDDPRPAPGKGTAKQKSGGPGQAPTDDRPPHEVILAWLECDECNDGQLKAVADLGPGAVPLLASTLREGLSPARRARLELQLRDLYERLQAYRKQHPERPENAPRLSLEDFLAHQASDARFRGRAALALGQIGTPEAEKALRQQADRPQGPSVDKAISDALRTIERSRRSP